MASPERPQNLDLRWGDYTCELCDDETWLSLVLYEPINVSFDDIRDGRGYVGHHPAPSDEEQIGVCANCLGDFRRHLAKAHDQELEDVRFGELRRYLIYQVYPDYVENLYPEEAELFEQLT